MVGCRAHGAGEAGAPGEEKGEQCGTPQRITLRDLTDETDGKGEEGCLLESILRGLGPAVTVGGGEVGEGPMEGTGEDGEIERCEGEVVGCRCGEGPLLGVGGVQRVE